MKYKQETKAKHNSERPKNAMSHDFRNMGIRKHVTPYSSLLSEILLQTDPPLLPCRTGKR
jgi:hypothetical protein